MASNLDIYDLWTCADTWEHNCGKFEITNSLSLLFHIDEPVSNKYVKHKRISKTNNFVQSHL